jgi:hypothetical protein
MTEPTEINDIRESRPEVDEFFCNWKMCIPSCDLSSFQRDCAHIWLAGWEAAREQAIKSVNNAVDWNAAMQAIAAMTPPDEKK